MISGVEHSSNHLVSIIINSPLSIQQPEFVYLISSKACVATSTSNKIVFQSGGLTAGLCNPYVSPLKVL
jgi:hypothetical protein